jgi:hypothetical protein
MKIRMKSNDDDENDDEDQIEQEDSDNHRVRNPVEQHRKLPPPATPTNHSTTESERIHNNPLQPTNTVVLTTIPTRAAAATTTTTTTDTAIPIMSHATGNTAIDISSREAPPVSTNPMPQQAQRAQHHQQQQQGEDGEGEELPSSSHVPTSSSSSVVSASSNNVPPSQKPVKLIKSTRLKGYMTLTLAAFIHLDAARSSSNIDTNAITIVPSTDQQRVYAQMTAIISLIGTSLCCLIHFDRITPLPTKVWIPIFFHTNGTSIYEGGIIIFFTLWWGIATGIATSVNGIAGDGKGQYSLYYSTWACCLTSLWLLERWFVASGWVRNTLLFVVVDQYSPNLFHFVQQF